MLRNSLLLVSLLLSSLLPVAFPVRATAGDGPSRFDPAAASADSMLYTLARLQVDWSAQADLWAEGFTKAISGERITYGSPFPDVAEALLSRATNGAMAIEWETGLPSATTDDPVTFVWMAGLMAQRPSKRFDLFVDGRKAVSFETSTRRSWSVSGEAGMRLEFTAVMEDVNTDLFGFMRLTVPRNGVRPEQPTRLRVVGEAGGAMTWVMTFTTPGVAARLSRHAESAFWYQLLAEAGAGQVKMRLPLRWIGRTVALTDGSGARFAGVAGPDGSTSVATVSLAGQTFGRLRLPIRVLVEGRLVDEIDRLDGDREETEIRDDGIVVLRRIGSRDGLTTVESGGSGLIDLKDGVERVAASAFRTGSMDVVTSSHQDIAWMDSPQACLVWRDTGVVSPALDLLERDPTFHYSIEQALMLEEALDRHPENLDRIRKLTGEGRLEWGATYNQPYEGMYSGESLVRGLYLGRRWLRDVLGYDARTAWNVDVPARTLQMAQILKKSGVDYLIFSRFRPGLFWWESPDGSRIGAYSPGHYHGASDFMRRKSTLEVLGGIPGVFEAWEPIYRDSDLPPLVPVVVSSDMSAPRDYRPEFAAWNALGQRASAAPGRAFELPRFRYNVMQAAMDSLFAGDPALPVVAGERPNVWLYIHGPTHYRAISASREAAHLLTAAETFASAASLVRRDFSSYPAEALRSAWKAQIYPDHGWGGNNGEITDSVFTASAESARDAGRALLSDALQVVASSVSADRTKGHPVVVFNPLAWERGGPSTVVLPAGASSDTAIEIVDADARPVASRVEVLSPEDDGLGKRVRVTFEAEAVPAVGYRTYYARSVSGSKTAPATGALPEAFTIENVFYAVEFGPGGVRQVTDKALGRALFRTDKFLVGELFTMRSEGNGAGEFAAVQQPTMEGFDRVGPYGARWERGEENDLFASFVMRQSLEHVTVHQTVRLFKNEKRFDVDVDLLGWDGTRSREFRLAFPLAQHESTVSYEVPFGVLTVGQDEIAGAAGERYVQPAVEVRPREVLDWISASDDAIGVTLATGVAVLDYRDPTTDPVAYTVLQPILLASRKSCHWLGNWYLQPGDHSFHFSLTSHAPGWQNGVRFGEESASPLFSAVPGADGPTTSVLEDSGSFLRVDAAGVELSTMKKAEAEDAFVVRLVEVEGEDKTVRLTGLRPFVRAARVNLIEDDPEPLRVVGGAVEIRLGHHAVETVVVWVE